MTAILVESALRGLLFAAIVGLGLAIFRVRNVPVRKAAWTIVLIASLAMPMLMRLPGSLRIPVQATWLVPVRMRTTPAAQSVPAVTASSMAPRVSPRTGLSVDLAPVDSDTVAGAVPAPLPRAATTHTAMHWLPVGQLLSWAYLAVTAVLLLRLLLGVAAAIRLWASADQVSPLIAPEPNVRASSRIPAPVTLGSGIVLPADYPQWDRAKLRMVIAHERSHVRQLDFYLQLLAGVYTALFWFSPLGWWLRHTLSSLGEAIGDRAGMQAAATRSRYAETLLEIAAVPHRSLPGVAMARSANLSRRVESMLNDQQLHKAFFEGKRRAAASLLIVPVALFAAVAVVRIPTAVAQASRQATPPSPADTARQNPATGQSTPPEDQVTDANPPQPAAQTRPAAPGPATAPQAAPPGVTPPVATAPAAPSAAPDVPPLPLADVEANQTNDDTSRTITRSDSHRTGHRAHSYYHQPGWNGDSFAIVSGPGDAMTFSGSWDGNEHGEIDKARQMANGPFLWFRHEGKAYIITDPAIIAQLQQMTAPMQELGRKQQTLGEKQRELGAQQRDLARQQREAGTINMPDMSKTMAEVNAAIARMKENQPQWDAQKWPQVESELKSSQKLTEEQMGEIQRHLGSMMAELAQQRAELQGKIAAMQGQLGQLQGEAGARMGAFGSQMGELGRQMGQLASEQGRLGEEQGRRARELHEQVQKIIQQSVANGTAKPVQ